MYLATVQLLDKQTHSLLSRVLHGLFDYSVNLLKLKILPVICQSRSLLEINHLHTHSVVTFTDEHSYYQSGHCIVCPALISIQNRWEKRIIKSSWITGYFLRIHHYFEYAHWWKSINGKHITVSSSSTLFVNRCSLPLCIHPWCVVF